MHTQNCCNYPKICTKWFYHSEEHGNDADGMGNSVDPDQTASEIIKGLFCILTYIVST